MCCDCATLVVALSGGLQAAGSGTAASQQKPSGPGANGAAARSGTGAVPAAASAGAAAGASSIHMVSDGDLFKPAAASKPRPRVGLGIPQRRVSCGAACCTWRSGLLRSLSFCAVGETQCPAMSAASCSAIIVPASGVQPLLCNCSLVLCGVFSSRGLCHVKLLSRPRLLVVLCLIYLSVVEQLADGQCASSAMC